MVDTSRTGGEHGVTLTLPTAASALLGLERVREPGDEPGVVRLNRNERLQSLPEWFVDRLRRSFQSGLLTNYPVTDGLYGDLSAELRLPQERILLTTGSDAALKALYHAYIRPGDTVVLLDPSYAMYEVYAQMFQARAQKVPFGPDLELDSAQLLDSVVPGVRMVVVANPNQPTSTLLPESALRELVRRAEAVGALLVVDEAYYPFSRTTLMPWVEESPSLVVTRTFSKAAGLAGLRVGFAAGHAEVIANMFKVRSVHDINSVAVLCASEILRNPAIVDDYVREVEAGAVLLSERVRALGLRPLPTCTNFLLIRVGHRCAPACLIEVLRAKGYLVRGPFRSPCIADCIRVTLGPPSVMAAFADVLAEALAEI